MDRFWIKNFGCRASQADGVAIEAGLAAKGLIHANEATDAYVLVLTTCTVTSTADDEVRQTVRRLHRQRPDARILITGCYAQRAPEELASIPGVSMVVGNSHKTRIPELVLNNLVARKSDPHAGFGEGVGAVPYHGLIEIGDIHMANIQVGDIFEQRDFLSAPIQDATGDRTRPNLKIQDGCNNRCSFCIIPFVRGRSRSSPADQVIAQVRALAARYKEVVLSGINLGRWGRDIESRDFAQNLDGRARLVDLLRRLLDETGIERLRLSSVEPMDFSDDLLRLMAESARIAKHVHAPLQSGSDRVLRRMHRKYRPRHYADRILKARERMPDCAVGADVMTGFPGETDQEFEESRGFIESLPFTYLHVFTYSARPGTPAAESADQVPVAIRKQRTHVLRELAARKNLEFRRSMIGKTVSAVTLDDGALTENYLKVKLAATSNPGHEPNQVIDVRIGGVTADGLYESGMMPVLPS